MKYLVKIISTDHVPVGKVWTEDMFSKEFDIDESVKHNFHTAYKGVAYIIPNTITPSRNKLWWHKRVASKHKCSCPTWDVVHFGCKCGGI